MSRALCKWICIRKVDKRSSWAKTRIWRWASFHMTVGYLYVFFRKMCFAHFLIELFVFLMMRCMSCLYILDINPLLSISFTSIFSHSVHFVVLLIVSLSAQKPLSLIWCHLFIFAFVSFCLRTQIQKILLWFISESVLPIFTSMSFKVSGLTFRSFIHYEFIFVYGVREYSNFILLHVAVQFSQHHLLKTLSFLNCVFLPPLSKIRWPYVRGFISGLSILFLWSICLVLCQYHTVLITVAL